MADSEPPPPQQERKKLTIWLIAGGVASLLLPLLAAVYLRVTESRAVPGPSGRSDLFERRERTEIKLTPSQTVVIPRNQPASPNQFADGRPAPATGSSLDFIKSNDDLRPRTPPPQAASSPAAAAAPAAAPEPAVAAKSKSTGTTKNAKKAFAMPKLQATKGFTSFAKGGKDAKKGPPGHHGRSALDSQAAGEAGGQDMSEMLKNLPPGAADDPRIQKMLKKK